MLKKQGIDNCIFSYHDSYPNQGNLDCSPCETPCTTLHTPGDHLPPLTLSDLCHSYLRLYSHLLCLPRKVHWFKLQFSDHSQKHDLKKYHIPFLHLPYLSQDLMVSLLPIYNTLYILTSTTIIFLRDYHFVLYSSHPRRIYFSLKYGFSSPMNYYLCPYYL